MKQILAKLLGDDWTIRFSRLRGNGHCYKRRKLLLVHKYLKPKKELDILLHEMLHATDWYKDEEWVQEVATDIAEVLWRLGYRRNHEHSEV